MSHELTSYLNSTFPKTQTTKLFNSEEEGYFYSPEKVTRWIYRCVYECDIYPRSSLFDTSTVLFRVLVALDKLGYPAVALTNLANYTLTDYGLGQTEGHNHLTSDVDPAILSSAPDGQLYDEIFKSVAWSVDHRNRFPPRDLYSYSQRLSRWPQIPPIVQLNQFHWHTGEKVAKPIVEFHPLSIANHDPESALANFQSLYAPFYVGLLGLPVLATQADQISDLDRQYYPFQDYMPDFKVNEHVYWFKPQDPNDASVHLSDHTPRPRLVSIGPRVALAAALGSINQTQPLEVNSESVRSIKASLSEWGPNLEPSITSNIGRMLERAASTQKWVDREQKMATDYPEFDDLPPPPSTPFGETTLTNALMGYLAQLGYQI